MILTSKHRFIWELIIIALFILNVAVYTGFVFSQLTGTPEKKVECLVTHENIFRDSIWYEVPKDGVYTIQFNFRKTIK